MEPRADPPVEPDGRGVPVEHCPLHPATTAGHGDLAEGPQEGPPRSPPPLLGEDEEVFQVQAGAPEKRRVREEVEGKAHGPPPAPADERLEVRAPAEAVPARLGGGDLDLVHQPLVLGEAPDERDDGRNVSPRAAPDGERGPGHQAAAICRSSSV